MAEDLLKEVDSGGGIQDRLEGLEPGGTEHGSKAVNKEVMTTCLEEPF